MARILVVDDEANIRTMIRMALQKDGHTVEQAADGTEALDKFGTGHGWDLVLLDQRMPDIEGLDVLRTMRARDPSARIVIVTAFGTIDLAVEAMKAGATDFLRKPFTLDMMRGAVCSATQEYAAASPERVGATIGFTTLNGFRIESGHTQPDRQGDEMVFRFTVRNPSGEPTDCSVSLPAYVVELVKAQTGYEQMPGGDAFWRGFSEEALANYVWQNAQAPSSPLRVDEFTRALRHWTDIVLANT